MLSLGKLYFFIHFSLSPENPLVLNQGCRVYVGKGYLLDIFIYSFYYHLPKSEESINVLLISAEKDLNNVVFVINMRYL
jgi:hypothetical protein